jgi:hypothetical protein
MLGRGGGGTPASSSGSARNAAINELLRGADISPDVRETLLEGLHNIIDTANDGPGDGDAALYATGGSGNVTFRRRLGVVAEGRDEAADDYSPDRGPANSPKTLFSKRSDPGGVDNDTAADTVDFLKKRKDPVFSMGLKFDRSKNFPLAVRLIYDSLKVSQMSYVFDLGATPVNPELAGKARAIAETRRNIMVGNETAYEIDQAGAYNILQQAFVDVFADIFLSIKVHDPDRATTAYERMFKRMNPRNVGIQQATQEKFLKLTRATWEGRSAYSHIDKVRNDRHDMQGKGTDVAPYIIAYNMSVAARRVSGPCAWASFSDIPEVRELLKKDKDAFTEDDLDDFFKLMEDRQNDGAAGADEDQPSTETGNLADATVGAGSHFCVFHQRVVRHKSSECSKNPKNRGKDSANAEHKTPVKTSFKEEDKDDDGEEKRPTNGTPHGVVCYFCKQRGHIKANCPQRAEAKFAEANFAEVHPDTEIDPGVRHGDLRRGDSDVDDDSDNDSDDDELPPLPHYDEYRRMLHAVDRVIAAQACLVAIARAEHAREQVTVDCPFIPSDTATVTIVASSLVNPDLKGADGVASSACASSTTSSHHGDVGKAVQDNETRGARGTYAKAYAKAEAAGGDNDSAASGPTWGISPAPWPTCDEVKITGYYEETEAAGGDNDCMAKIYGNCEKAGAAGGDYDCMATYGKYEMARATGGDDGGAAGGDDDGDDDYAFVASIDSSSPAWPALPSVAAQGFSAEDRGSDCEAVVDSGASVTLLKCRDRFDASTLEDCPTPINTAGTGTTLTATARGRARLRIVDPPTGKVSFTVEVDALYCPALRRDLISVPGLSQEGYTTQFGPDGAFLVNGRGDATAQLIQRGKLWLVQLEQLEQPPFAGAVTHLSPEQIWHLRLGHVNSEVIANASRHVRGMPALSSAVDCPCHDCMVAKARKAGPGHLGVLMGDVSAPLELVFLDISGPMRTAAIGPHGAPGYRYSLIIVDAFHPRRKWDIPLRSKSDAAEAFDKWITQVQALVPLQVKRCHTDQGGEFTGKTFAAVCAQHGILHHFSCAYEPRQNGVVERAIGTLTRYARAMLATSNAPLCLWWLARAYAAEIVNALPFDGDMSADEVFFQEHADVSLFYPFGCWCFAHKPRSLADDPKLGVAGEEGIIVGTGSTAGMRAFAVYTKTGKLIYAVSVRVDMTYFPFRPTGQQRVDSDFFKPDVHTTHEASWDPNGGPLPPCDAVFVPVLVEGGTLANDTEHTWTADDTDPKASIELHIDTVTSKAAELKAAVEAAAEATIDRDTATSVDTVSTAAAGDKAAIDKASTASTGDKAAMDKASTGDKAAMDKASTAAAGDDDVDLHLPDGRWAPDFIGRRVTKVYKRNAKTYHGEVVELDLRPHNKRDKIMFRCFFDEDQDYDVFNYQTLLTVLDDQIPAESVFVADAATDDAKGEYMPDVVASRVDMLRQPDRDKFIEAEAAEVENMERHEVLEWAVKPHGAIAIGSKFVYKRKRDQSGKVVKHKARLVAQGFSMRLGVDYLHSSSPVATMTSFRLIVVIAMLHDMEITCGDVDGAFLNAQLTEDIDETLYMKPPKGFEDPTGQGRVFRLKKSIYGLKQASYCWHKLLSSTMRELGYRPVDGTECLWLYDDGSAKGLFAVHVDDFVHCHNSSELDSKLVSTFTELWGVSNVGPIAFHLGMEVCYVKGESITITQRAYFEKVLKRFGYEGLKSVDTPMDSTIKISLQEARPEDLLGENEKRLYMEIVGSLIYGAVTSRPDISNAVAQLGRMMNRPSKQHMHAAKRVLRYVAGTLDRGLRYRNEAWTAPGIGEVSASSLIVYTDSDWAGEHDSRKSMSGHLAFVAGGVISFRAALQKIQALSSAEAEYVAISDAAREIVYITNVLQEIGMLGQEGPIRLLTDSSAALAMAQRMGVNHRTKHIALRYHFIRSLVNDNVFTVDKVDTERNPADILTKATDKVTFLRHADLCVPRV